jgi:hypothetical protein
MLSHISPSASSSSPLKTTTKLDNPFSKPPSVVTASNPSSVASSQPPEDKKKSQPSIQALPAHSQKESDLKTLGRYALAIANAGIFTQNLVAVLRAPVLDFVPQPFTVVGSLVNLASCFVPSVARLPLFVAGTSLYMGGSALSQSHMDQVNVSQMSKREADNMFDKAVRGSKWNSFKEFPHPDYLRAMSPEAKEHYQQYKASLKQGRKLFEIMPEATEKDYKGFMHMAHPGCMASLARNKYYKTYFSLMDQWCPAFTKASLPDSIKYAVPSFVASSLAGAKQLGWMVGKMATDWRFAHDALMPTTRREFVKGTLITTPNAPSYVLAIGSVIPLLMLSAAMLTEGSKKVVAKHTSHANTSNQANSSQSTRQTEDPFAKQPSSTVKLVANVSSIIPQLANLMFLPIIWREGGGNPLHIHPTGLKLDHAITPRFNATLVGTGSLGALVSALTAVVSDVGLVPRYVAYLSDIAFMAFSGVTSAGLARTAFENTFRNTQSTHLVPTPNALQHARQLAQARLNGFLAGFSRRRVPQTTPLSKMLSEADSPKKKP